METLEGGASHAIMRFTQSVLIKCSGVLTVLIRCSGVLTLLIKCLRVGRAMYKSSGTLSFDSVAVYSHC